MEETFVKEYLKPEIEYVRLMTEQITDGGGTQSDPYYDEREDEI